MSGRATPPPCHSPDTSFDYVVCMAAFKSFADPGRRPERDAPVPKPRGRASIYDLRKDAPHADIDAGIRDMHLSAWNSLVTRWIFRFWLLNKAYTLEQLERMAAASRFGRCEIATDAFRPGVHYRRKVRSTSVGATSFRGDEIWYGKP